MNCIDCKNPVSKSSSGRCIRCSNINRNKNIFIKEGHPFWKGIKASYKSKHCWINRNLGKANKCSSKDCNNLSTNYEWANISGEYNRDLSDWVMLCHSCNVRMDYNRKYGNKCRKGHDFTEENTYAYKNKRMCLTCVRERKLLCKNTNMN